MKNKGTALIVDDEEIVLEIEEFMFQKIGFEILIAKNSAQACELYQDEKDNIDLVVLDMIMPDENGGNTYKQLKKINPNIKVIVSSGMGKGSAVREILNDWPNRFLPKPFKFEEFTKSVDAILSLDQVLLPLFIAVAVFSYFIFGPLTLDKLCNALSDSVN